MNNESQQRQEIYDAWERHTIAKGIEQGIEQGVKQGVLNLLTHQLERHLKRPLSQSEHQTLRTRFDALGPDRLSDIIYDLLPPEIEQWLAQPNPSR